MSQRNRKVLFLVPNWKKASEQWLDRMILDLKDEISGVICNSPQSGFWHEEIPVMPFEKKEKLLTRLAIRYFSLQNIKEKRKERYLLKILNSREHDVIYIHFATLAVKYLDIIKKLRKPVFVHCHGYDITFDLKDIYNPSSFIHPEDYHQKILELSNYVTFVANSNSTAEKLISAGIPGQKIKLLYFGIPVDETITGKEIKAGVTILFLGRLVDFKGPDLVIRAFDLACGQGLDGRLIIAGDGPLRVTCELLIRELQYGNRITMTGESDWEKSREMIKEADIFTAHNRKGPVTCQEESFGVSILEAMAAGIPVITGRNGGVTETVVNNETGILIEPGDISAHSQAFLKLAGDIKLRQSMGENAKKRIQSEFSTQKHRESFLSVINSCKSDVPDETALQSL